MFIVGIVVGVERGTTFHPLPERDFHSPKIKNLHVVDQPSSARWLVFFEDKLHVLLNIGGDTLLLHQLMDHPIVPVVHVFEST
jgi:hypothetical protein